MRCGIRDAEDAELELDRVFRPPGARSYTLDAWTSIAPDAPDSEIDRLAGIGGAAEFRSSGRSRGWPATAHRAPSTATAAAAWVADRLDGEHPVREVEAAPAGVAAGACA